MTYQVVLADLERDKADILRFWRENNPKSLDLKYHWIYENNPAGLPLVWLVRHQESGECVGMTAIFPRNLSTRKGKVRAGVTGDLLVNPKHRTLGPAIKLLRKTLTAIQEGKVDLIYTFPNKAAEGVARAAGYRHLGRLTRLVKVLRARRHLQALGLPTWLVSAINPLSDLFLRLISMDTWTLQNRHVVCRETTEIDERFRTIWQECNQVFEVVGERNEDYLKWKFLNDPDDVNKIIVAYDSESNDPLAYLVYRPVDQGAEIREFVCGNHKLAAAQLMAHFFRTMRRSGANSIEVQLLENKRLVDEFGRYGFRERGGDRNVFVSCSDRLCKEQEFPQLERNWLLMASDQDT